MRKLSQRAKELLFLVDMKTERNPNTGELLRKPDMPGQQRTAARARSRVVSWPIGGQL